MVRDFQLYTRLSRIANGTFGTTGPNPARVSTQSIKFEVIDENTIKVKYQAIVTFASKSMLRDLSTKYMHEGLSMIAAGLERFTEDYSETFEDEKKIKLVMDDNSVMDSVEYVSYSMYKPTQTAFFRVSALVNVK